MPTLIRIIADVAPEGSDEQRLAIATSLHVNVLTQGTSTVPLTTVVAPRRAPEDLKTGSQDALKDTVRMAVARMPDVAWNHAVEALRATGAPIDRLTVVASPIELTPQLAAELERTVPRQTAGAGRPSVMRGVPQRHEHPPDDNPS